MRTLRGRLIFSHILPVLIVTPLIGVAIYAVVLTQGALSAVESTLQEEAVHLADEAAFIASLSGQVESIWQDPAKAQEFLSDVNLKLMTVTLLDSQGRILASSEAVNAERVGGQLAQVGVAAILTGESSLEIQVRDPEQGGSITDILVPVFDAEDRLAGVLLLSQEVSSVGQRMASLSRLLLLVVILLLMLAILVGLWLALRLERALQQVTGTVYAIANGERPSTLPVADVDEIDALYRAVDTLVARLHTLEDARRRLLANLVHELGRPLGSMLAAVDALRRGAGEDPVLRDELLTGIGGQIARMQPLLEDLTQLHGQVLGSLELNREPTVLSQWLPQVMTLWRQAAIEKELTWRADIPLDLPVVNIDRDQMSRALGNLFSNAVKYTPAGGMILVETGIDAAAEGTSCWIRINDTGPGIPAKAQATVFEPFQRGQTDRRFPQGMGLGLSIARDIAVAHGGCIDLESGDGTGSQFTVTLPIHP
jgi:signal transduction histidine kinase